MKIFGNKNSTENGSFTRLTPVFKVVSLAFTLVLLSVIFHTYKIYSIRHNWISITGVVVKTSKKGWWDAEKQRRYYLAYQYQIDDKLFTSSQFHIKEDSLRKSKYLYSSLKKDDTLQVFVNPTNHEQAVINTDYLRNGALFFIVISGFMVMAQTIISKELTWEKRTTAIRNSLAHYKGDIPLPNSPIVEDNGYLLKINTGMSAFWNFGLPFFALSFICIAALIFFTEEINPGWSLFTYLIIIGTGLSFCASGAGIIRKAFSHQLQIDSDDRQILDSSRFLFWEKIRRYAFSEVEGLRLYQEEWRHNNSLRNWILFIQTKSKKSVIICHHHRNIQPASKDYLDYLQKRIEYILRRRQE